jgi:hypothetical protein
MLKPQFSQQRLADLLSTEKHIKRLLHQIFPENDLSRTLNLAPLFLEYTQNNIVEHLLGEDTMTVRDIESSLDSDFTFESAFALSQEMIQWQADYGKIYTRFFHPYVPPSSSLR